MHLADAFIQSDMYTAFKEQYTLY